MMSLHARLTSRSTFTGLGACFFAGGVVLLFVVLFHGTMRGGPVLVIAGGLLVCAIASWIAAARAGNPESGEP
jgi:hypothetical protein